MGSGGSGGDGGAGELAMTDDGVDLRGSRNGDGDADSDDARQ